MRFLDKLRCAITGHDAKYLTDDELRAGNWMRGVFRPFTCRRCGYESGRFQYPPAPPMPLRFAPDPARRRLAEQLRLAELAPVDFAFALRVWGDPEVDLVDTSTRAAFLAVWAMARLEWAAAVLDAAQQLQAEAQLDAAQRAEVERLLATAAPATEAMH